MAKEDSPCGGTLSRPLVANVSDRKKPRNWVEISRKALRRLVSGRLSRLIALPRWAELAAGTEVGKNGEGSWCAARVRAGRLWIRSW